MVIGNEVSSKTPGGTAYGRWWTQSLGERRSRIPGAKLLEGPSLWTLKSLRSLM